MMLWLLKMDLSLPSPIGLLMLTGIVTKNSIPLVEYAVMTRRERGMRSEALVDACSMRLPHRDDHHRDGGCACCRSRWGCWVIAAFRALPWAPL
ncbi:MAG: efflux RND transporter permease subunit [Proteobacteria bacterium]|nr:efflux RND transporter permease subunit [Pseudomonadota bacterium]